MTQSKHSEDDYQKIQRIYLDWHDKHRPLSGFVKDIEHLIHESKIEELERVHRANNMHDYDNETDEFIDDRIEELKAQLKDSK